MTALLTRPSRSVLMAVTGIGMLLTVLIFIWMRSFETVMTQESGVGIVGYELAFTPERATEIVSGWGSEGQAAAQSSLLTDYVFMPAYAAAFGGLTLLIARMQTDTLRLLGISLAAGCIAAALLDALENLMLLIILNTGAAQPFPPLIAGIAASGKFVLLALALLYWFVGGIVWLVRRQRIA